MMCSTNSLAILYMVGSVLTGIGLYAICAWIVDKLKGYPDNVEPQTCRNCRFFVDYGNDSTGSFVA